jgi:hypothetical protein
MDQKPEATISFFDGVDKPEIFTAFSALETFEDQGESPFNEWPGP